LRLDDRQEICSCCDDDAIPEPDVLAGEIIENLEAGLNSFREIAGALT
jgi:type I restriction enzyme M protein